MAADLRAAGIWLDGLLEASGEGIALFDPSGRVTRHNALLPDLLSRPTTEIDGWPMAKLVDAQVFTLGFAHARSEGTWQGRLTVSSRELDVRIRIGADGYGVMLCHDLSERLELGRRAETLEAMVAEHQSRAASARELLFQQSERLTTLYQITLDSLESAALRDTAARICSALQDDLGAENVALWLLSQDEQMARRIAAAGPRARALPISCHRRELPELAEVLASRRPIATVASGPLAGLALVPLPGRDRTLGLLTVDQAPDLDRVDVYAPHVSTGLNNAIMAEELAGINSRLRMVDRQKTEFLNDLAHDLRTPLTCIRTYTDLMRMYVDEPPETYAEFLQVITEETERLAALLDNFLDLARLENATIQYQLEPLRVEEIASHFENVYLARADAEDLRLACLVDSDLPVIIADRRRLEQCFSNLLSNAFKFTPRGGRVAIEVRSEAGGVMVSVTDSGSGVPVEDRERIFERFKQARNTERSGGGTGLGLAITHAIIKAHGGTLGVEDGLDAVGSRFWFWLPVEPPPGAEVRTKDEQSADGGDR